MALHTVLHINNCLDVVGHYYNAYNMLNIDLTNDCFMFNNWSRTLRGLGLHCSRWSFEQITGAHHLETENWKPKNLKYRFISNCIAERTQLSINHYLSGTPFLTSSSSFTHLMCSQFFQCNISLHPIVCQHQPQPQCYVWSYAWYYRKLWAQKDGKVNKKMIVEVPDYFLLSLIIFGIIWDSYAITSP